MAEGLSRLAKVDWARKRGDLEVTSLQHDGIIVMLPAGERAGADDECVAHLERSLSAACRACSPSGATAAHEPRWAAIRVSIVWLPERDSSTARARQRRKVAPSHVLDSDVGKSFTHSRTRRREPSLLLCASSARSPTSDTRRHEETPRSDAREHLARLLARPRASTDAACSSGR